MPIFTQSRVNLFCEYTEEFEARRRTFWHDCMTLKVEELGFYWLMWFWLSYITSKIPVFQQNTDSLLPCWKNTLFSLFNLACGFLISAFRGVPQWLVFAPPADVPCSRPSFSLQLPWGVRLSICFGAWLQPVHLPSLHRPLLSFAGHGAAAGPRSQQPGTLPLRLCSNIHLILL